MSPIHLSPLTAIHLSPNLAGGVRLSGCLHFICHPLKQFICLPVWLVLSGSPDVSNSFVFPYSKSGLWCPARCMSPIHLFSLLAIHLSPSLAGGVRVSRYLQFIRLPLYQSICLPVWLVASGYVSNSLVSPYSNSFVSQSGWWCPALRMSPIHLSPLIAIHVSPNLAGGVRLSGCLQFICLPLQQVWLVVSGSPDVSNSFVSPYSNSFVSQSCWWCPALRLSPIHLSPLKSKSFVSRSGWWCPALRMSPFHLSPFIAIHLSPSLAGGVRLSGCLQFICLPLKQFTCLPVWLVVSGSPDVLICFPL